MEVRFVTERADTFSAKYRQSCGNDSPGLIYCGVADMDAAAPEILLQAMRERLDHGVMGYTDLPEDYKKLVAGWMETQYDCPVSPDWVLFSPRINMALNMVIDTFTKPGDSVIVNTPAYPALTDAVEKWGRTLKESPLILSEGKFRIDFDGLEQLLDERTSAYLLCNPHNPTGRVWSKEELEKIVDFCKRHDLILLSDDIHADFVWQDRVYTPVLKLYEEPEREKVVIFNSMTKTLNIPGLIFSNVILPNPIIRAELARTIDRWGLHNPNVFVSDILRPAYTECSEWICKIKALIFGNICMAETFIKKKLPEFDVYIPEGTYLMWIGYERTGWTEDEMKGRLENQAGLVPLMGSHFKEAGRGYFRLNMGTSKEQATEILERLVLCWA